jgi:hypothetical protein
MPTILACVVLLLLGTSSSYAQWEPIGTAWTDEHGLGSRVPRNSPYPLEFYLTPTPERDPANSLCPGCPVATTEGPAEARERNFLPTTIPPPC